MNNEIRNRIDFIRMYVKDLHGLRGPKAEVAYQRIMERLDWLKDDIGYAWRQYDAHVRSYREMMT